MKPASTRYEHILEELERFLNRYHSRNLLQGLFLFVFFGGITVLLVGGLEYFLWMPGAVRSVLFWGLLGFLGYLLVRHIVFPALQLLRIRRGISPKEGSRLIGSFFPEVADRLYNLLELSEQPEQSELIRASIEQRSSQLSGVPFYKAAQVKEAFKYARYALIPAGIVLLIWVSGKGVDWLNSYKRVARYNLAFESPAPFRFELVDTELEALENTPFVLKVRTAGTLQPEEVRVVINGTPLLMEDRLSHFETSLRPPLQDATFYFEANGVRSGEYQLSILKVPLIDRFEMEIAYPGYLGGGRETIKGSGNASVPEGSSVRWALRAINTDTVHYSDADTLMSANRAGNEFTLGKKWFKSGDYAISTSNARVRDFDQLAFHIQVIRDEYPKIEVGMQRDTLNPNQVYFGGVASDDYGMSALELVCRSLTAPEQLQVIPLGRPEGNFEQFYYTFPSGLQWVAGQDYVVYFQVRDNDGVHGGKVSKTADFPIKLLDASELEQERLNAEKALLEGMKSNQLQRQKAAEDWDAFLKKQKEQKELGYSERQELQNLIESQKQQEKLMEKFSKSLDENLEKEPNKGEANDLLQERLERQEMEARKNAALLEELQKVMDKLDREELQERLEELGKNRESNQRSLEQLLELTKRYYITQKARELGSRLEKVAERQEILSRLNDLEESFGEHEQEKLNTEFQKLLEEVGQFEKDNQALRKPLPWKRDAQKEAAAGRDQKEALDLLQKQGGADQSGTQQSQDKGQAADQKQNAAARKIKELAQSLEDNSSGSSQSENAEDAETLRQILDNLVIFSLQEEGLFEGVRSQEEGSIYRSGDILRQQELRKHFEHVDDSLFALSLRQADIAEQVNKQITEVYYNVGKSLESLSENQWYRGAAYQQYVITASNELAAMLAEILENMQSSLKPGNGQGGSDFQLPDIIQSMEQLQERMQGGSGNEGKPQGQGQQEGKQGQSGENGESGMDGNRQGGKDGQGETGSSGGEKSGTGGNAGQGQEMGYEELFEIYKEQQRIRAALEEQLKDLIDDSDRQLAKRIAQEMERFENELLENGVTNRTGQRLTQIKEQLLRLKNAAMQQGESKERESRSNYDQFTAPILTRPESFENQGEEDEILSRQALPLRLLYKNKVKRYFNADDRIPL